jgi:hypothetical protein
VGFVVAAEDADEEDREPDRDEADAAPEVSVEGHAATVADPACPGIPADPHARRGDPADTTSPSSVFYGCGAGWEARR